MTISGQIDEIEERVRRKVADLYFRKVPAKEILAAAERTAAAYSSQIRSRELREIVIRAMKDFARKQYRELFRSFSPVDIDTINSLNKLAEIGSTAAEKAAAKKRLEAGGYKEARMLGVPMQKWQAKYLRDHVRPALDRLMTMSPEDPDDAMGRNRLRNRAEMQVRYEGHMDQLDGFRAKGVKLVIISAHADCSARCAPFQGRVFSLDGTSGRAPDGRRYEPIEKAINVEQKSKDGTKTWINGLFGFNCRHYAIEYKDDYRFPEVKAETRAREDAITRKQRSREAEIRRWRIEAIETKGRDPEAYKVAVRNVTRLQDKYLDFCLKNKRPTYRDRLMII